MNKKGFVTISLFKLNKTNIIYDSHDENNIYYNTSD